MKETIDNAKKNSSEKPVIIQAVQNYSAYIFKDWKDYEI
jgi:hypothetical protein